MATSSDNRTDRLAVAFNPTSIAIVGASTNPRSPGFRYVKANVDRGFDPVYPINPNTAEVYGRQAYDSITDLPDTVDLAIVLLRADLVPGVLEECGQAGVPVVHIGSSGFSEAGTEAGRELEREIATIIDRYDLTVIGPNCMGLFNAAANITYFENAPTDQGTIAYASHSGGFTLDLLCYASALGLPIGKGASIGNSVDVTIPELIDYYLTDDETSLIGLYLEGVADRTEGDHLVQVLRDADKPVIALKGGRTDRGGDAAESHTGALAGNYRIWQTLFTETNVREVYSLHEMLDLFAMFSATETVGGRATAVVGPGGGTTVVTIDKCADVGLSVPPFEPATISALESVDIPAAGNLRNPVDVPFSALFMDGGTAFESILEIVSNDPSIDSIIVHVNATHFTYETIETEAGYRELVEPVLHVSKTLDIPLLLVLRNVLAVPPLTETALTVRHRCAEHGIATFSSMDDAVFALSHLADYSMNAEDMQ